MFAAPLQSAKITVQYSTAQHSATQRHKAMKRRILTEISNFFRIFRPQHLDNIIYFLCFRFLGKRGGMAAATAATVVYMAVLLFLHRFRGDMSFGFRWYNSIPCFALGMWYCAYREKLNDFIRRKQKLLLPLMPLLTAVLFAVTVINPDDSTRLYVLAAQILSALAFSAAVLVLSLRLRLGGPFLSLCGDLSLELYLFHAVFIYIWRSNLHLFGYTFYIRSDDIFFAAVLLWTFVASYVVHIIQKRIFKRNTEKNNRADIFSRKKY